uniref:Brinker DNA-binding domain-containing protein n=1 Tax=Terrapene triunguis TaxID=2587831 RepID=A0A674IUQ6_9SAUR
MNGEIKRKRSAYHAAFKLKVAEYAEANNNCAAAREFCINEKQVRECKKKCPTWCASFPDLEKDLNNWVVECRQNGYSVTRTGISLRAGWGTRFMNCHGLCLRQRTKTAGIVSIPMEVTEKSFQKCCISNALDWSEDDDIFDDDTTETDDEKESESEDDTADIYDDNAGDRSRV